MRVGEFGGSEQELVAGTGWDTLRTAVIEAEPLGVEAEAVETEIEVVDEEPLSPSLQGLVIALDAAGYDSNIVNSSWNELSGETVKELLGNILGVSITDESAAEINRDLLGRRAQRYARESLYD